METSAAAVATPAPAAATTSDNIGASTDTTLVKLLKTVWPIGLRRWFQVPVRKGVGSNPTAVNKCAS